MMIENINNKEMKLAKEKAELIQLKNKLNISQSKIQTESKEFWSNLGITNAEGRKAYIIQQNAELTNEICHKQSKIVILEAELKCLEREWDLLTGCRN